MKKLYTIVLLLAIFTFGLELLNLHLADKLASAGVTVRKIQENIAKIEESNQVLNIKVLELASFETVSSKAISLGFIKTQSYISLKEQRKFSYNN